MFLTNGILEAFGLTVVRTSAFVMTAPLFGLSANFSGFKVGLITILSLVLFASNGHAVSAGPIELGLMGLREVLIGITLAFVLHLVMLAVRVASELVGHEMAFNMSRQADPATGISVPLVSQFYDLLFSLALFSVNAHLWFVRALSESMRRAPVGDLRFDLSLPQFAWTQFTQLFAAGLTFAAPMMVLLSLVSVTIALLARTVPHINVMEFSFSLRVAGGMLAMYLFAPALEPAMKGLLERLMDGLGACLDLLGA